MVYDVACSDGLSVDPVTNRCPDNGARVNINDCSISQDVGSAELKATWSDPNFDPAVKSFYYVRVLENPTCRWSTWDAIKAGLKPRAGLHQNHTGKSMDFPYLVHPTRRRFRYNPISRVSILRGLVFSCSSY